METQNSIVRRLTPTECSLLQGFPPDWCDIGDWTDSKGKVHKDSDSPKYKALGNSICLPFWSWMSGRMVEQLKKSGVENPTMASLFDGISGFPLVYARHGCTPVWTSEIEEYPIAVCKKHFGDEQTGEVGDLEKYLSIASIGAASVDTSKPEAVDKNADVIGSLCASDYKGIRNQDIDDGKAIIQ